MLKNSFDNFGFLENIKLSFDFEFLNSLYFWDSKKVEVSAYHKNMFEECLSFIKNLDWCKSENEKKCSEIFRLVFFGLNILSEKNCELIENVLVQVVMDLSQQGNFEKVRALYIAAQKEDNKDFCNFFSSVDRLIKRGNNLEVWDPKQVSKEDRNNFLLFYNFILLNSEWLGIGKKEKVKKFLDLFFCTLNNQCANGFDHIEAYIFIILLNCAKRRVFKKVELLVFESVIKFRCICMGVIKLVELVKQFLGDYVPTENEVDIINRVPIFLLRRYVLLKDSDFEYLINGFKSFLDQSDLKGFIKLLENIRKIRCRAILNGTGEMDRID